VAPGTGINQKPSLVIRTAMPDEVQGTNHLNQIDWLSIESDYA
jgi:hypothetical protein